MNPDPVVKLGQVNKLQIISVHNTTAKRLKSFLRFERKPLVYLIYEEVDYFRHKNFINCYYYHVK